MTLSLIATTGGILLGLFYTALLVQPSRMRAGLTAFPRHRVAGIVLSVICLCWVAWLLDQSVMVSHFLRRFGGIRPVLGVMLPLSIFLVTCYMPDLLAPRALGGLMLLLATPILEAIRWDEPIRLVVTVLCYVMIIKGMALVLSPFYFRMAVERWLATDRQCRLAGVAGLAVAVTLLVVGVVA